jgi:hypothetical protein
MDSERVTAALSAQALDAAAREHKRMEAYHRRRARELRQQHADFIAELNERGITVHIDTDPQEGHSHG